MKVRNRREMAQLLNERMTRTYTSLSQEQELEPDTSLVKTYLIEAHLPESAEPDRARALAEEAFSAQVFGGAPAVQIHRAEEPTLLSVEIRLKHERLVVYVDFTNPRYWLLHSMASSNAMDRLVKKFVSRGPAVDRAWLPADMLERVSRMGSFRGLGLDYDRSVIPDVDFDSSRAPVEVLKMQLWGNKASDILRILRQESAFPHATTLSKVKVKFQVEGHSDGDFCLDDIKYDGKVTARGTSFQSHIALVSHIYEMYAKRIRHLEERYALRPFERDGCLSLHGEPINFLFDPPIMNLEIFCESVFSCGPPFRLWGVPVRLSEDFYRVQAVDLHAGNPLQFEIAPDFLRLYLPAGSCGNTVLRLYTNLQHHYDSLIRARNGEGEDIFEF